MARLEFNATPPKIIKRGSQPGSGPLREVAADYTDETRKIDTFASNWAAQMKHSRALDRFDINDIRGSSVHGEAYLLQLKAQASQFQLSPVLITNKPVTSELHALLGQLGIEHRRIDSPFE